MGKNTSTRPIYNEIIFLQSNAGTKSKAKVLSAVPQKKKGGAVVSEEQWAQWQKKDAQVVIYY